jgi:hypothetical protein
MSEYVHHSTPDLEFKELLPNLPAPAHGPIDIAAQREQVRTIVTPLIMETHRPRLPAGEPTPSSLSGSGFIHGSYPQSRRIALKTGRSLSTAVKLLSGAFNPSRKRARLGVSLSWSISTAEVSRHTYSLCSTFLTTFYPAFVTGDLDIDDFFLRTISVDFRISIVNVDYR